MENKNKQLENLQMNDQKVLGSYVQLKDLLHPENIEKIKVFVNKQSFEDYLQERFFNEEPTTLDDEFPDKFNDWLGTRDVDDIIEYAEKWGNKSN